MIKHGIATITERRQNEIHFITKPTPPLSKEVPANIFILHALPTPNTDNPAIPNVRTPISAALRLFSNINLVDGLREDFDLGE